MAGGANGGDIAAATQPFNLTVPWGDAWSTGAMDSVRSLHAVFSAPHYVCTV